MLWTKPKMRPQIERRHYISKMVCMPLLRGVNDDDGSGFRRDTRRVEGLFLFSGTGDTSILKFAL